MINVAIDEALVMMDITELPDTYRDMSAADFHEMLNKLLEATPINGAVENVVHSEDGLHLLVSYATAEDVSSAGSDAKTIQSALESEWSEQNDIIVERSASVEPGFNPLPLVRKRAQWEEG